MAGRKVWAWMVAVLVATGLLVGVADVGAGATASNGRGRGYLAVGDSIPFGYSPLLEDPWVPEQFVGYPEIIGRQSDIATTNLSCPGQTAQALVSRTAPDGGCFESRAAARDEGFALLHTDYPGTQLDAARRAVKSAAPPKLISIQAGGNEVSICLEDPNPGKCLGDALPKVTKSLQSFVVQLRAAGSRATIVLVGYHLVPGLEPQLRALNHAIATAAQKSGAELADSAAPFARYAARHGGDLCSAGLLVRFHDGSCDLHPSRAGQRLLAQAVLDAR